MRYIHVVLVLLLLVGAVGCASPDTERGVVVLDETPPPEAVETARTTADQLSSELVRTLFRELEAGDPAAAIDVCAEKAREIAADLEHEGTEVRRVSRRFRNPANEPDEYEYRKLREMEALHARGELPTETAEVVSIDGVRTLRYMKPILLKPPCTMCHGQVSQIDDDVLDAIHSRYPGDRAIGFEVDDLRGAITVKVAL
jgi:hypothetical protein